MQQMLPIKEQSMSKNGCVDGLEHEINFNVEMYGCDFEETLKYHAACVHVECKHCGCKGISVDDTGTFWSDELIGY